MEGLPFKGNDRTSLSQFDDEVNQDFEEKLRKFRNKNEENNQTESDLMECDRLFKEAFNDEKKIPIQLPNKSIDESTDKLKSKLDIMTNIINKLMLLINKDNKKQISKIIKSVINLL